MIDICNPKTGELLSVSGALQKIQAAIRAVEEAEIVELKNAAGRVLSKSVYSPINIPYDKNAAMDGYAFSSADIIHEHSFTLKLSGTSWAGYPFTGELHKGQCLRVFTGAALPVQADSVVMQEHVRTDGQYVHFSAQTSAHQHIRKAGEDVQQGGLLCADSKKLTVYDLGLLASAGIQEVTVKRKINIAFLSTGDELTPLGQALESGKIYDSNRYLLNEFLRDASYEVTDLGIIADNKQLLQEKLMKAANQFDVIITTGGASVGDADYIQEVLASCGRISFWKLAIKPGKPLAFGRIGDCHFFGLPGNPVSVIVTFQQIVAPALRQLSGALATQPLRLKAICTTNLKKSPGRLEFQRGILAQNENGDFFVASSGDQGSNLLGSMSRSNCFIVLPAQCGGVRAGDTVLVEPFLLEMPAST
ncbi:MAG: molybdopterin molybdotransferase MoeA [Methylococcaceae bacterium]|nr:molybdopterin molybdotransferase MoeA [Methylococcaceae bacterium]